MGDCRACTSSAQDGAFWYYPESGNWPPIFQFNAMIHKDFSRRSTFTFMVSSRYNCRIQDYSADC
jgi:hypothetical protein